MSQMLGPVKLSETAPGWSPAGSGPPGQVAVSDFGQPIQRRRATAHFVNPTLGSGGSDASMISTSTASRLWHATQDAR